MPWVPIHESGLGYNFSGAAGVAMTQSAVAYGGGSGADVSWELEIVGGFDGIVRITPTAFLSAGDNDSSLYHPAYLEFSFISSSSLTQYNESPPYPDANYANNDPITAFLPNPVEVDAADHSAVEFISYTGTAATSDFLNQDESYSFLIEVWQEGPEPPEPIECEEHGRTTRAYVSGYQRDRVHQSRIVRGEKRCMVANFNGAIPASRTIVSATWRCDQNQAVLMEDAAITDAGRCTKVMVTAQVGSGSRVKCQVTLDNGEVYNQLFVVSVYGGPWFQGEPSSFAQGPTALTVTA